MKKERITDLILEIKAELGQMELRCADIERVQKRKPQDGEEREIYEESLALKLSNFYTACERIFKKIAEEVNSGLPRSLDWHKRLLTRMTFEVENIRPAVISPPTAKALDDYLGFRHVVRNIYGFELDSERLNRLVMQADKVFLKFKKEVEQFLHFLNLMRE